MRVSKETAVLLKEAGYDVPTTGYYIGGDGTCWASKSSDNHNSNHMTYSAPTLHEAADWLRSKGVHVYTFHTSKGWRIGICLLDNSPADSISQYYDTHESAYEAGIVHGLKYIK